MSRHHWSVIATTAKITAAKAACFLGEILCITNALVSEEVACPPTLASPPTLAQALIDHASSPRIIRTPWGDLSPKVDVFPLVYLLLLYGVIYFLPFGAFDAWRKGEDGPVEWLQFLGYFFAGISALVVIWKGKKVNQPLQLVWWVLIAVFCLYVAGEEISWGERLTGFGFGALRDMNAQGESNLHNLDGVQNYLHFSFIVSGLFFGWFGWRFFPSIEAFPAKRFSLFFLFVAAFYAYWDLSWITLGDRIRNDQEAIELLMSLGLFLHCFSRAKSLFALVRLPNSSRR